MGQGIWDGGRNNSHEYLKGIWRLNHSFLKVLIGRNVHTVASVLARARSA